MKQNLIPTRLQTEVVRNSTDDDELTDDCSEIGELLLSSSKNANSESADENLEVENPGDFIRNPKEKGIYDAIPDEEPKK